MYQLALLLVQLERLPLVHQVDIQIVASGYSTASVERDCNNSTEEADLFIEDNLNLSIEYVYELLTT